MIDTAKILDHLAGLSVTEGRLAGESFTVLPWQRRFVRGAFGADVGEAALSVPRGAGKTTLLAGVASATLDGPLMVPRGLTVIVASSLTQARVAFDHVKHFLGPERLRDRKRWRLRDSQNTAWIERLDTGAVLRCIGSDPKRAHGLSPLLVLADEPAQWPESTGERMVAALRTSLGKQPASRLVALGTRPAGADHWFQAMLDGGADYAACYAARPDDPPFRRRTWHRANPSLKLMPDLLAMMAREAKAAKRDPSLLATFKALRLNQGTSDTLQATVLDAGTWERIEGDAERAGPVVWGLDLGTSAAMSAICAYWFLTGRLEAVAAFPETPTLEVRGLRDGVGGLYRECARRGEIVQCGGRAVALAPLFVEALRRFGAPVAIAGDRWRLSEAHDALKAAKVPRCPFMARGQGYKDGGEDMRAFRRACLDATVRPVQSLLMRSAMAEARAVMDPAGNVKLCKGREGGRRMRARDDAVAAAILAVAEGQRRTSARPAPRFRYHGPVEATA